MNDGLLTILGGLLGSSITVLVTKILEIFQKKSEYKGELKKQFFLKKLQAGETAMIQYTNLSVTLQQLSVLYIDYGKLQTGLNQDLKQNFLEQINSKLELINSSSLLLSSSIGLYFDFKRNNYESMFVDISKNVNILSDLNDNANNAYEKYTQVIGLEEEEQAFRKYEAEYDSVLRVMKDIGIFYQGIESEIQEQMKQIRNEMRKYE